MIIDRRSLLQSGAAVTAATLIPGLLSVRAAAAVSAPAVERFVFDSRFSQAIEAARTAASQGIRLSAVSGDLTSLWYADLNLKWKRRPMALAGVTAEDALFVLGTLAPEYRMRVVHREELGVATFAGSADVELLPLYAWRIAPTPAVTPGI